MVDNRWIVPYSPFLCGEFDCHINVECAVSLGTFKYAFKYIQKGPDLAALEVNRCNEVKRWIEGRYISAPDAVWRIFHFPLHEQIPNVVRLQVHLPNHHMVTFNPNENLDTVLQRGASQRTTLTAFLRQMQTVVPLRKRLENTHIKNSLSILSTTKMIGSGLYERKAWPWAECISSSQQLASNFTSVPC